MTNQFEHPAQNLPQDKPLIYTAFSKHLFYLRMFISVYVLEENAVPLNPFMVFDYFLLDRVNRDAIREANNNLIKRSDEMWVFGQVSDGVLSEIQLAKSLKKPIRYLEYINGVFYIIKLHEVKLEAEVEAYRYLL